MVTYAAPMAKRPPQGRGSGGRVTPSPKRDASEESTDAVSAKDRPKARVPQASAAGRAKVARTAARETVKAKAVDKTDRVDTTDRAATKVGVPRSAPRARSKGAAVERALVEQAAPDDEPVRSAGAGIKALLVGSADPDYIKPKDRERPWWGMGDMLIWFVVAQFIGVLGLTVVVSLSGYVGPSPGPGGRIGEVVGHLAIGQQPSVAKSFADLPLHYGLLLQVPFWLGLIGGPIYAVIRKGRTLREDFGVWMTWTDIPLGLAIGVFTQVVLVAVLYKILFLFIHDQDVSAEARKLTDRATTPAQVALLFVIVVVGAPIAEELFFRGLALHAITPAGTHSVSTVPPAGAQS